MPCCALACASSAFPRCLFRIHPRRVRKRRSSTATLRRGSSASRRACSCTGTPPSSRRDGARPSHCGDYDGDCPSMTVSLSYGFRSFHLQFHDSQIISPCLDSLLVGEMGVVSDDLAVVDQRGCRDNGIGEFQTAINPHGNSLLHQCGI